jgi:hypothetical protein
MTAMGEQGVIEHGAIDPSTFRQEMFAEVRHLDSVVLGRSEIGAWARVP